MTGDPAAEAGLERRVGVGGAGEKVGIGRGRERRGSSRAARAARVACSDWMLASDVRVFSAGRQLAAVGRHDGGVDVGGGEDEGRGSSRWTEGEVRGRRSEAASVAMMERRSSGALVMKLVQFVHSLREGKTRLTLPTMAQACSRPEDAKVGAIRAA